MAGHIWCDRQILITLRGPAGIQQIRTTGPFARIGSHPQSEVVLSAGKLPQRICYLHATELGIYCLPLVEKQTLGLQGGWLDSEQEISVGSYRVTARLIHADGAREQQTTLNTLAQASSSSSGDTPLPSVDLRGPRTDPPLAAALAVRGPGKAEPLKWRMRHHLVVLGRAQPSDVRIKSNSISRVHLVLYWDECDMWFVDLLSLNGTIADGTRIDSGKLRAGQVLKFEQIRVWYERTRRSSRIPRIEPIAIDQAVLTGIANVDDVGAFELHNESINTMDSSAVDLIGSALVPNEVTHDPTESIKDILVPAADAAEQFQEIAAPTETEPGQVNEAVIPLLPGRSIACESAGPEELLLADNASARAESVAQDGAELRYATPSLHDAGYIANRDSTTEAPIDQRAGELLTPDSALLPYRPALPAPCETPAHMIEGDELPELVDVGESLLSFAETKQSAEFLDADGSASRLGDETVTAEIAPAPSCSSIPKEETQVPLALAIPAIIENALKDENCEASLEETHGVSRCSLETETSGPARADLNAKSTTELDEELAEVTVGISPTSQVDDAGRGESVEPENAGQQFSASIESDGAIPAASLIVAPTIVGQKFSAGGAGQDEMFYQVLERLQDLHTEARPSRIRVISGIAGLVALLCIVAALIWTWSR